MSARTPVVEDFLDPRKYPEEIRPPEEVLVNPHQLGSETSVYDSPDASVDRHHEQLEATDAVSRALTVATDRRGLDPIDAKVLREHYGLLGTEQVPSLDSIGLSMGVSGSRVKQRETRATESLRVLLRSSSR